MPTIETVSGPVEDTDLGIVLAHEHLTTTCEAVRLQWPHLYDDQREYDLAVEQVRAAMDRGVKTIVDPACMDLNRNVPLAVRVAEETGAQLVMATGVYGIKYTYLPPYFENREPSAMVDVFLHDIEEGIQGTGVKAAFLKCAVDEPGITEHVERVLRAIAQTSLQTGRPIMAHSHPGTRRGLEIMDFFEQEGIDPRKVQIAHTGDTDDLDYIEELLARGCWIGMDRYGLDIILPTEKRNATVIELCRRGYADRMMLSHDACATIDWLPEETVKELAPNWHFTYLWEGVLPALSEGGVSDEQIDTMLRENPRAWLTA